MQNNKSLIVFARYPEYGKVKTRLASSLGDETAYKLYELFAGRLFNELKKLNEDEINFYLFYSGEVDEKKIALWCGKSYDYYPQAGNDLGDKMYNAVEKI